MNGCKFCGALMSWKQIDEFYKVTVPDPELGKYCCEYTAALVIRHWYSKKGKRSAGRTTDYRHMGLGFKLNYCPECGRRLMR